MKISPPIPVETLKALRKAFGRDSDGEGSHATGSVTPKLSWLTWQEECPTLDIAFKRCESIYNLRIPHVVTVKPEQSRKVTKGVRHFHIVVCINRSKA